MRLLVIGNGFDIDLGILTTYKDFFEKTNYGKDSVVQGSLEDYLYNKYRQYKDYGLNWFDVEESITEYIKTKVMPVHKMMVEIDKMHLKDLKCRFYDYIIDNWIEKSSNLWKEPIKQSMAKALIEKQNRIKCFSKIYSFNCLDYNMLDIASGLEIEKINDVVYLHGHSADFIFGVAEEDCMYEKYSFLVKKNQKNYPSKDVEMFKEDLLKAEEVVIFGHSLNRIDMCYFKTFFQGFAQDFRKSKRLTIITKNYNSKDRIIDNISKYAIDFKTLAQYGIVSFILTDQYDKGQDFINQLNNY